MKTIFLLGVALASLPLQAVVALEPAEAGRQGREDLDALIEKQRREREAAKQTAKEQPKPPPPADSGKRRKAPSVGSRIPTICKGC